MSLRTALFLFCIFFALPAAADDYVKPTLDNLVRTLARFGAIDIKDDALLDEYAMITDCDLVSYFYKDDFRWNQVRGSIRESIGMNIGAFPNGYQYNTQLQLGRYDFGQKLFRFTEKASVHNVNSFLLLNAQEWSCDGHKIKYLPTSYRAVLDVPVTVPGLPLSEKDADALFKRLGDAGNEDHVIYTRFNLSVAYIEPLHKSGSAGDLQKYMQFGKAPNVDNAMRFDVRLDSVNFYEDEAMTKLIYSYRQ
jgi:hypothetical protein